MKLLLVMLLSLSSAFAQQESLPAWLSGQWAQLTPYEMGTTLPSLNIPIDFFDRRGLDMAHRAVERNEFLNPAYRGLAQHFAQCLKVPLASWYHFAYLASKSSGSFMNGDHFRSMSAPERMGMDFLVDQGLIPSADEFGDLLGHVNFLVGVEMIPLGRLFLETFCTPYGALRSYETFGNRVGFGDRSRNDLHEGYAWYHRALSETDMSQRIKYVAYGTTLLMMGEQRRVQESLDHMMNFGGAARGPIEYFYRYYAARTAGLVLNDIETIPFVQDVQTIFMRPELAVIDIPGYRALHEEFKVPLTAKNNRLKGTAVNDWANLRQRLAFLIAVVRGHAGRPELMAPGYPDN